MTFGPRIIGLFCAIVLLSTIRFAFSEHHPNQWNESKLASGIIELWPSLAPWLTASTASAQTLTELQSKKAIENVLGLKQRRTGWAASTGFLSVPHARALMRSPSWHDRRGVSWLTAQTSQKSAPLLAVVGHPIDNKHVMLRNENSERFCVSDASSAGVRDSHCLDILGKDKESVFSSNYGLCRFHLDCWHSTAAAIIASGNEIASDLFSFEALSRLSFWNATNDHTKLATLSSPNKGFKLISATFLGSEINDNTEYPDFPGIYENSSEFPFLLSMESENSWIDDLSKTTGKSLAVVRAELDRIRRSNFYLDLVKTNYSIVKKLYRALPPVFIVDQVPVDSNQHELAQSINYFRDLFIELKEINTAFERGSRSAQMIGRAYSLLKEQKGSLFELLSDFEQIINQNNSSLKAFIEHQEKLDSIHEYVDHATMLNEYNDLPAYAYPLVELYSSQLLWTGTPIPSLVNKKMVLRHGARNGGPIFPLNVFSHIQDPATCKALGRSSPCILTNIESQRKALEYILLRTSTQLSLKKVRNGRGTIQAVLIVAGGSLTTEPCDNTPTAKVIAALRANGIFTFVPVGNDGVHDAVRFPACASDAIAIGALDRDGNVMPESNGTATDMVDLYIDGDTVVLPMRAPPPKELAGCVHKEAYNEQVRLLQELLNKAGFDAGITDGTIGPRTRAALRDFQISKMLEPTERFDKRTLEVLFGPQHPTDPINRDKEYWQSDSIARNIKYSDIDHFEQYSRLICNNTIRKRQYQAYIAGGTLVSASAAAGVYTSYVEKFPNKSAERILQAMAWKKITISEKVSSHGLSTDHDYRKVYEILTQD